MKKTTKKTTDKKTSSDEQRMDDVGRTLRKGEYQRKDGKYEYRYRNSENKLVSVYSDRLTIADKGDDIPLREKEKHVETGVVSSAAKNKKCQENRYSLNCIFEEFIEQKEVICCKGTINDYRYLYNRIANVFGKADVRNLRVFDVRKYLVALVRKESNSYAKETGKFFSQIVNFAYENELVNDNVVKKALSAIPNEKSKPKKKAMTKEQQEMFVDELYSNKSKVVKQYRDLITFLLCTGCRIGEATALQWDDVDLNSREIRINKCLKSYGARSTMEIGETKTESGNRIIPMTQTVYDILLRKSKEWKSQTTVSGYHNFIFFSNRGKPFTKDQVCHIVKKIASSCADKEIENGIQNGFTDESYSMYNVTTHTMRHTFCTRLSEVEPNIKAVQTIMGHADSAITLKYYTDSTKETSRCSMRKLSENTPENMFVKSEKDM